MKHCGSTLRRCALRSMCLLAGLLGLVCGSPQAQVLHTEKSLYRDIIVYQEDGLRCMRFGRYAAARQTCVTLAEPDKLVFDYTKMMMAALYLNPSPKRVLILGLGGGTLPNTLRRLFPEARIDVAEIDPAVVRMAKQYFNFKESDRLRVTAEDGRVFVKRARSRPDRYDLVMLDAFDHEYIPEHLLTKEFFQEVRNIMTDRGVLAANTFSGSRLYHYESATYYSVFGDFYGLKKSNRVILARLGGLPDRNELWRNADAVEARLVPLGTDRATLMSLVEIEKGWPADTRILTDQFSPSNLLNAK